MHTKVIWDGLPANPLIGQQLYTYTYYMEIIALKIEYFFAYVRKATQ